MFNQIQYFISVVKNHNFTKAAEECHISQPAISQQVKELEETLGVELLERKGRSFKVTAAGQYFYQHGQDIIKETDALINQTKEIGNRKKQPYVLRAGYLRNFGTQEFLEAVAKFSKAYPDVQVKITSSGHEHLYDLLRNDQIDFAFSDLRRAPSNTYVNDFLTSTNFQVILSNGKFGDDKKTITTDELKDMPCILIVGPNEEAAEEEYYRDILGVRSQFITAQTYDEAAVMAASGQGYLLMNDRTSKLIQNNDALRTLTLLNNGKEMTQNYYAFWKADNSGFYIETFADYLKEQFDEGEEKMTKTLIAYYSQSGSTKRLADQIAAKTDADILEITVAPGTFPDDMFATNDVSIKQREENNFPTLTSKTPDLSQYDAIVVAGPNWSSQLATPLVTFLNEIQDFNGKVISVNTSVGQNDDKYNADFKARAGKLNVVATINGDANAVLSTLK